MGAFPVETELFLNPVHGEKLRRFVESSGCPIAGPRIFPCVLDHPDAHGVEHDLSAQFQKIHLPIHHNGIEPPLQHMPHLDMPPVEGLRVDTVELAHGLGQIGVGGLEKQVELIDHEEVDMTKHIEPA